MATRQGSMLVDNDDRVKYTWTGLLNSDSGTPVGTIGHVADYTVQTVGTFGAGGSVAIQGSNDGTNYLAIDDFGGTTIAMTTTKIWKINNPPTYLKPVVTAGDGTTSLSVYLSGELR